MDVLRFKSSAVSATATERLYPLSTIKKVAHTVAANGSESLTIIFENGTETLRDSDDITKVLATLKAVDANENQIAKAKELTKKAKSEIQQRKEAKANAEKLKLERAAQIRAELEKNKLKKTPAKKVAKTEKKVTKKTAKKVTKKVTKKKSKKKTYKK